MSELTHPSVVRFITRLNIGGPARHVSILSRMLAARGFESELVYGSEAESEGTIPPGDVKQTKIPQLKRSIDPVSDLRALGAAQRLLRDRKPDIVHTHLAKAGAIGRWAAARAGVPVVLHTYHGHVLDEYFSRATTATFAAIERFLASRSDALVAVSRNVRDSLLELGIGRPEQWHVVPLGLELQHLLDGPEERARSRAILGLPSDAPLVGIVGRLVPIKDHDTFLKAAARILQARPDVHFLVAGDGGERARIERTARATLGDRVHFLGWVTDLSVLYGALDLVVLTSRNEGTPVALVEAAASGLPVVGTAVGGVPEVVEHGRTGFLVEAGRDDAIAEQVVKLLNDDQMRRSFSGSARVGVAERFAASRLVDDISRLYDELLSRKRKGSD